MKIKIQNSITKILILFLLYCSISFCDQKNEKKIDSNQNIKLKIFSSLTCPHCANFHKNVVIKLKGDNELNSIVQFEHIGFPLDLAALNAEKVLYCIENQEKRFKLLTHLYDEQDNWASGSDINVINESLKKIGNKYVKNKSDITKCLKDEEMEEKILQKFLDAQKDFKITSTPTIFINQKKYEGKHNYKDFKKEIKKLF